MQFQELMKVTKNISNHIIILLLTFIIITKKRNIFYLESVKVKLFLAKYDTGIQ